MAGVGEGQHAATGRCAAYYRGIRILTTNSRARPETDGTGTRGQGCHRAGDSTLDAVSQRQVRQGLVARVGNDIGPGHHIARGDVRSGHIISVITVSVLAQHKAWVAAVVVRRVGVGHGGDRAERRRAGHDRRVGVLTRGCRAGQHTGHAGVRCQLRLRTDHTAFDVVAQGHVGQGYVAGIADFIGPGYDRAHRNDRSGRQVGVHTVGIFNHLNRRHRRPDAQIPVRVILATGQQRVDRAPGHWVGVAVGRVVAALVAQGDDVASGQGAGDEANAIEAWHQVGKAVIAGSIGRRHADDRAVAIEQFHRHAHHAAFAAILDTIIVGVIPDPVTDAGERLDQDVIIFHFTIGRGAGLIIEVQVGVRAEAEAGIGGDIGAGGQWHGEGEGGCTIGHCHAIEDLVTGLRPNAVAVKVEPAVEIAASAIDGHFHGHDLASNQGIDKDNAVFIIAHATNRSRRNGVIIVCRRGAYGHRLAIFVGIDAATEVERR